MFQHNFHSAEANRDEEVVGIIFVASKQPRGTIATKRKGVPRPRVLELALTRVCFLIFLLNTVLSLPFPLTPIGAQSKAALPRIVNENGHAAFMLDGRPYLILGAQVHNSSSWPEPLSKVWVLAGRLRLNTVEAPVYWEQLEPLQGQFDYSNLDTLIQQARAHHLRLILLWFGAWKNGRMHYAPEWVKSDTKTFSRMMTRDGDR
jgi:hypothetical protein